MTQYSCSLKNFFGLPHITRPHLDAYAQCIRAATENGTRKTERKRMMSSSDKMGYKYVASLGREQPLQKMQKRDKGG
jgi:hypothetical protein